MHIALTKRSLFYTLQKHIWADLLIGGISEEILFLLGLNFMLRTVVMR